MSFETPTCACCHRELPERGAILYGPPEVSLGLSELCAKWHLCTTCYDSIVASFPKLTNGHGSITERPVAPEGDGAAPQ
jgi:hypothetical protein